MKFAIQSKFMCRKMRNLLFIISAFDDVQLISSNSEESLIWNQICYYINEKHTLKSEPTFSLLNFQVQSKSLAKLNWNREKFNKYKSCTKTKLKNKTNSVKQNLVFDLFFKKKSYILLKKSKRRYRLGLMKFQT